MTSKVKQNENESELKAKRRAAILRHAYGTRRMNKPSTEGRLTVKELGLGAIKGYVEVLVLRRYPRRQVNSANYRGPVAAACGRDETGVVGLVLWGKQVDEVRTGDVIRLDNGWCRRSHGELVVSSGRTGELSIVNN